MKNGNWKAGRILTASYIVILVAAMVYSLFLTGDAELFKDGTPVDFSKGWHTDDGKEIDLTDYRFLSNEGGVVVAKTLPAGITDEDDLWIFTRNLNLSVYMDGTKIYGFTSRENLTGMGYGSAFHQVGICGGDVGKELEIRISSVREGYDDGKIWDFRIATGHAYYKMFIGQKLVACFLSLLIFALGILLVIAYIWIPNKRLLPYNLAALGLFFALLGLWCLIDTSVLQLLTGKVYPFRIFDKLFMMFQGYIFICFINSTTREKNRKYEIISFWTMVAFTLGLLLSRYLMGLDMIFTFQYFMSAYIAYTIILSFVIFRSNLQYCKRENLPKGFFQQYYGLLLITLCVIADLLAYSLNFRISETNGFFTRAGIAVYAVIMIMKLIHWWSGERASVERDRFVNRALQYAISANAPEVSIRAILEYLGKELKAKRTYIYEDQRNGTYLSTYEWFDQELEPRREEDRRLPVDGLITPLYELFKVKNRLIVEDVEDWKKANPLFYAVLKRNDVKRMVVGPIIANGQLIGLFGVDDAPRESLAEISEIIGLISYFFGQLVLQREEQKRLVKYSFYDALTGARNRRALGKFEQLGLSDYPSYGILVCDINGLKVVNDTWGHDAGDEFILDVARCLMEVFGEENVYRMGGDEFLAYGLQQEETEFYRAVNRVMGKITALNRSASLGAAYNDNGRVDNLTLRKTADQLMYEEKRKFYEQSGFKGRTEE